MVNLLLQFRKRRQYLQQRAAEDRAEEDGPSSQVCISKSKSKFKQIEAVLRAGSPALVSCQYCALLLSAARLSCTLGSA